LASTVVRFGLVIGLEAFNGSKGAGYGLVSGCRVFKGFFLGVLKMIE